MIPIQAFDKCYDGSTMLRLSVCSSGAIYKPQPYLSPRHKLLQPPPYKITLVNSLTIVPLNCNDLQRNISFQQRPRLWNRRWLQNNSLSLDDDDDDEYRSSRNIAISLFRRYRNFVGRGGGDNLKEFIGAGVNAYALGCTDEGLRKELADLKKSGVEIEAMQSYGVSTSLKYNILSEEINECILWLSIIFITILCTPQPTIVRWSATPPVSDEVRLQWKGFCAVIANAYYVKGMAWLPVRTLQLEQMAVVGRAEEAAVVASRMQLVFSTLEVVSPQWPRV